MRGMTRFRWAPRASCWSALWLALWAATADAADAPPTIAAEAFIRPAEMGAIKFSPDGSRFAAMAESKGQVRLAVVDFKTNQGRSFYSDAGSDVYSFRWLTNDLISIRTYKRGVRQFDLSEKDFQPAYISVDGKSRMSEWAAASALGRVPGSQTDVVAMQGRASDHGSRQLVVVDSTNGAIKRRLTQSEDPGPRIHKWVLDSNLMPRAAMGWNANTRQDQVWWRPAAGDAWRLLLAFDSNTERGLVPVAMDANDNLLVLSNQVTGRDALYRVDRATGKLGELLAGHPEVDIKESDLHFVDGEWGPVSVTINADRPQTFWFDEQRARVQAVVDASLPKGNHNALQFMRDGKVLVNSRSDRDPGTYYLYDPQARSLAEWTRSRPWIHPEQMAPMQPWRYRARDGLEIPAYLTLPLGREPKHLPLVVWVHGGPQARDHWGFDSEVQFLANRGYAVLQPNFRGSTGYGDQFESAGYRQWGAAMQDDLVDGVRALIADGRVDPKRICIGGASYGGYAALMGVIRDADLFRCAIDYAGPTDLAWVVDLPETDYNRITHTPLDRELEEEMHRRVGNPDDATQREQMQARSPRLLAAKVKAPVLLAYGTEDRRVPLRHGTAMRDALASAGANFEWKSYAGEGHGVLDTSNTADLMRRIERLLERSIGPGATASPETISADSPRAAK